MGKQTKYYAVRKGRDTGIFYSWETCKKAVDGFPNAEFKSFLTIDEATNYLSRNESFLCSKEGEQGCVDKVTIYTDGSYDADAQIYGSGVCILAPGQIYKELFSYGNNPDYTNSRNVAGEILAVELAIKWAMDNCFFDVSIFYDYTGIEKWAKKEWKANIPLTQAYQDFITDASKYINIEFVKVKGHSNNKYNDRADAVARLAVQQGIKLLCA